MALVSSSFLITERKCKWNSNPLLWVVKGYPKEHLRPHSKVDALLPRLKLDAHGTALPASCFVSCSSRESLLGPQCQNLAPENATLRCKRQPADHASVVNLHHLALNLSSAWPSGACDWPLFPLLKMQILLWLSLWAPRSWKMIFPCPSCPARWRAAPIYKEPAPLAE